MEEDYGLTLEQTDKIIQFQDLCGIEDMATCRDFLQRHDWDLEIAVQEHLNMREGRPSVYASEARPPTVVHDTAIQQFHPEDDGNNVGGAIPGGGITGLFGYVVRLVVSVCYDTMSSILNALLSILRWNQPRLETDPVTDVMEFISCHSAKYPRHPVFYQGTYAQALNDAKRELKFLVIYLHQESTESIHFCRDSLGSPDVINLLNTETLFWGCDIRKGEGWRVSQALASKRYPHISVLCIRESRMTLIARSEGPVDPMVLIARLNDVMDRNRVHLQRERQERAGRELTAMLRASQDAAYEESLAADQEKERQRMARQQEERAAIERLERETKEEREAQQRHEKVMEIRRTECLRRLLPEPQTGILLRLRLPDGEHLTRRFASQYSTQVVYDFVFSHPDSPEEFELLSTFPRRVIPKNITIEEANLKDREVLFVKDLNA